VQQSLSAAACLTTVAAEVFKKLYGVCQPVLVLVELNPGPEEQRLTRSETKQTRPFSFVFDYLTFQSITYNISMPELFTLEGTTAAAGLS
jgi:hypothetical protein